MGGVAEQQTIGMTDQMCQQLEQFGMQTQRGLEEIVDQLRQVADQTAQMDAESEDFQVARDLERGIHEGPSLGGNGEQQAFAPAPGMEAAGGPAEQRGAEAHRIIMPEDEQQTFRAKQTPQEQAGPRARTTNATRRSPRTSSPLCAGFFAFGRVALTPSSASTPPSSVPAPAPGGRAALRATRAAARAS
jgi:hypothetical protein